MNFAEYLRKSKFSEKGKVYYGRFLQNGLQERFVTLVKVNEEGCVCVCVCVCVWGGSGEGGGRWLDYQSFCWTLHLNIHKFTTLLRVRLHHLIRDTAVEKECYITMLMTLEHVTSEIQKNRSGREK